jgi:hypothetical protein
VRQFGSGGTRDRQGDSRISSESPAVVSAAHGLGVYCGSIAGALLGGIPAWLVWFDKRKVDRQEKADREEKEAKRIINSLMGYLKLIECGSTE